MLERLDPFCIIIRDAFIIPDKKHTTMFILDPSLLSPLGAVNVISCSKAGAKDVLPDLVLVPPSEMNDIRQST